MRDYIFQGLNFFSSLPSHLYFYECVYKSRARLRVCWEDWLKLNCNRWEAFFRVPLYKNPCIEIKFINLWEAKFFHRDHYTYCTSETMQIYEYNILARVGMLFCTFLYTLEWFEKEDWSHCFTFFAFFCGLIHHLFRLRCQIS